MTARANRAAGSIDIGAIRQQFPITRTRLRAAGTDQLQPLVYLDHAASTHPPTPVLDVHRRFLQYSYSNVHRGRHHLSQVSTEQFERARAEIRRFINASGEESTLILLGNTTQALQLAAHVMAQVDGVTLVSLMEHHSNDLPHRACGRVVHFGLRADGTLDYEHLERMLGQHRVKLVAVTGASNVTGYMPDVHRIARLAHAHGARILVDAAQLLAHARIDVRPAGTPEHIDFLAAAGHKAYAPFGASFLHAPRALCDAAPPCVPGGGTVAWVTEDDVSYKKSPERHEGGTPNVAGVVALGAALRYLADTGMDALRNHESVLAERLLDGLARLDGVTVLGSGDRSCRIGIVSFCVEGVSHERVATLLDRDAAIAVRNGCFCAHPYLHHLLGLRDTDDVRRRLEAGEETGLPGAVRASLGLFNTEQEVEKLLKAVALIRDAATR